MDHMGKSNLKKNYLYNFLYHNLIRIMFFDKNDTDHLS